MKIKHVIVMLAIAVIALVATSCAVISAKPAPDDFYVTYDAELLMPGNTLVTGECEDVMRISSGWIRVKINGTWYACNEWRVVLKELD